jgi:hypothetical protein
MGADHMALGGVALMFGLMFMLFFVAMYFLPALIAALRKHPQTLAIFVLNLLLGWSVIGWIGSLVWSLTNAQPTQTVIVHTAAPTITPPPSSV